MTESAPGWLPGDPAGLFGEGATAEETYDLLTVDVPAERWISALETARDRLGCTFFDWLSAVDEPGTGFRVCAHVVALPGALPGGGAGTRRLLLRTTVPHEAPSLPTAVGVYAGAAWHERETHEMFGIDFPGHPHLAPLLLPDAFEGHPLRKDFVLAARVAKAWPGAKEPGESADGGPKRRQMLPPGVPDPNEWGPLKGQLPPAPSRPARTPRAAGDRPVRRTRTTTEGSATQAEAAAPARRTRSASEGSASQADGAAAPARRTRSASDGSASQVEGAARSTSEGSTGQPEGAAAPARRTRSAADGSASQAEGAAAPARRTRSAADGSASQVEDADAPARRSDGAADGLAGPQQGEAAPRPARRPAAGSPDAPWHHARPAFEEEPPQEATPEPQPSPRRDGAQPERRSPAVPESPSEEASTPEAAVAPEPQPSPRRDGAQPERRSPAVPESPSVQAAGTPESPSEEASETPESPSEEASETPESPSDEAPGAAEDAAGRAGRNGDPQNDTNPAGGDPA
ncbi:NADH-quinone oxidoreductase subunit C [Streptomyces sp. NPDC008001]|uniref:NADH-quinone oxidoreductase subunit C n=1 Tax=Streptomyces sp. NPDC008001 TaxID=3364804 RepID=UPI0036EF0105